MLQPHKFTDGVPAALALALQNSRKQAFWTTAAGKSTLVAGTVTVTGQTLFPDVIIKLTANTVGGAAGFLSAPSASRTATQFVIQSSSGTDTSTVDWEVLTPNYHYDVSAITTGSFDNPTHTALQITSATATDLPTVLTMCAEIASKWPMHISDAVAHAAADATNTLANAAPIDQTSANTFLNDAKTKINAHLIQATVHAVNDTVNTISAANASNLATSITLVNAIKAALNPHILRAPPGFGVQLVAQ
ncbi:MAG TPA: hypothetical protein VFT22_10900 [Kofleriaceae bacterium]|nr:hypothetical protein [Kofleriaceae bacterium]